MELDHRLRLNLQIFQLQKLVLGILQILLYYQLQQFLWIQSWNYNIWTIGIFGSVSGNRLKTTIVPEEKEFAAEVVTTQNFVSNWRIAGYFIYNERNSFNFKGFLETLMQLLRELIWKHKTNMENTRSK